MQIISSAGELRALLPEIGVLKSNGVVLHGSMVVKLTSAAALSRASSSDWLRWDTVVIDRCDSFNSSFTARLYAPMDGSVCVNDPRQLF